MNKIEIIKNIALIAHDNCKGDLLQWAEKNKDRLQKHNLFATGTTGELLASKLNLKIQLFKSGPLGGDLQIGAAIVDDKINYVVFFWDPLKPHPHDVDVKALLRIAAVYNIPVACNRSSADFMITSPYMDLEYNRQNENIEVNSEDDLGIKNIIEDLVKENITLVEKYRSGFKSIIGTLADKAIKKLGNEQDKEKVKIVLERLLNVSPTKNLTDSQKEKILSTLFDMLNREKLSELIERYFTGDKSIVGSISKKIKIAQYDIAEELIKRAVEEYFESCKEYYDALQESKRLKEEKPS